MYDPLLPMDIGILLIKQKQRAMRNARNAFCYLVSFSYERYKYKY
jgi:hypothetical protein